jgi:hypothetical protein
LNEVKVKVEESMFSEKITAEDFVPFIQTSPFELIDRIVAHRRSSDIYDELCADVPIEELPIVKSSESPILLEEVYLLEEDKFGTPQCDTIGSLTSYSSQHDHSPKLHIFILVHGLRGCQTDLLSFKNYITLVNPNAEFIVSKCNSNNKSEKKRYQNFREIT